MRASHFQVSCFVGPWPQRAWPLTLPREPPDRHLRCWWIMQMRSKDNEEDVQVKVKIFQIKILSHRQSFQVNEIVLDFWIWRHFLTAQIKCTLSGVRHFFCSSERRDWISATLGSLQVSVTDDDRHWIDRRPLFSVPRPLNSIAISSVSLFAHQNPPRPVKLDGTLIKCAPSPTLGGWTT